MRRTYSTRPQGRYSDVLDMETIDLSHAYTVFEPSGQPRFTGLLDKAGNRIMVTDQIDQIGFIRR